MSGHLFLHAGMAKTGTSSIQRSLSGFSDDKWLWFDDAGKHTNHILAIKDIASVDAGAPESRGARMTSRQRFEQVCRTLGPRTLAMSSEGILDLAPESLLRLRDNVRTHGIGNVRVAAYVKSPAAFVTSIARAKMGGLLKSLDLGERRTKYRAWFEKLDQVFGRENVQLWAFDSGRFPDGCVVADFCRRVGIDFPLQNTVRINESLSREAVALLFTYRKYGGSSAALALSTGPERRRLVSQLAKIGQTTFRFSPDLLKKFIANNERDIAWMEERLGEPLVDKLDDPRPDDVGDENDLLRSNPGAVGELRQLLGDRAPKGIKGESAQDVAMLVNALIHDGPIDSAAPTPPAPSAGTDTSENTRKLMIELANSFPDIPRPEIRALMKNAFDCVNRLLAEGGAGSLDIESLGRFDIQQKPNRKVIDFHPADKMKPAER